MDVALWMEVLEPELGSDEDDLSGEDEEAENGNGKSVKE